MVLVELTEKEARLLVKTIRDVQKAIAWESEDDAAWESIQKKARRALAKPKEPQTT